MWNRHGNVAEGMQPDDHSPLDCFGWMSHFAPWESEGSIPARDSVRVAYTILGMSGQPSKDRLASPHLGSYGSREPSVMLSDPRELGSDDTTTKQNEHSEEKQ